MVRRWGGWMGTLSPSGPLVLRHGHNDSTCYLTAITSLTPVIHHHHYQSQMFFPEWTYHTCWLHVWLAVLNLTGLIWIPRGCVTKRRWLVSWPPIPFNHNHSHSSCSFEIWFMQSRNRFRHLPAQSRLCYAYFGFLALHFFTVVAACTLHVRPRLLLMISCSTLLLSCFICPTVLTLSLEYVFQRDQLLQESCRISCSCFSFWNSS